MRYYKVKKIMLIVLAVVAMAVLFGLAVMLLWNALVPELFNGPEVSFWQALGLFLLTKLLFGGIGRRGGPPWRKKSRMGHLQPEDREKLKKRFMCKWSGKKPETTEPAPSPQEK